jgi:hypothetical protein
MGNLIQFAVIAWVAMAWLTHVIVSISTSKWILLLVGAFVFPVGCVHGTGIWFGIF